MRDPGRPAAHPLVELVHDLRTALERAESDRGGTASPRALLYERAHGTLRSARRFVDALELLVAELETQSDDATGVKSTDEEADDADFQRITVR